MVDMYQMQLTAQPMSITRQSNPPASSPNSVQSLGTDAACAVHNQPWCLQPMNLERRQAASHGPMTPASGAQKCTLDGFTGFRPEDFSFDTPFPEETAREDSASHYLQSLPHPAELRAPGAGQTAVSYAAEYGRPDMLRMLIEHGADHTIKDGLGCTPLHKACEAGHVEAVRILLSYTPTILHERNNRGFTALHVAVQQNRVAVVKLMVEQGASTEETFPTAWAEF